MFLGALCGFAYMRHCGTSSSGSRFLPSTMLDPAAPDSDGDTDVEYDSDTCLYNIRTETSGAYSDVARAGLLWKLERRFCNDLKTHDGQQFGVQDRFAYLEN